MKRTFGKKIAFGFAAAAFIGMAASSVFFVYFLFKGGVNGIVTSSVFATILFFMSCGVVLYLMSKPQRYALRPWDEEEKKG
ncbi:MAG: hypothetical protein K8F27_09865 [Sulfuricellaceae bacterium]|nr:hypothetical protein [Sulfuricellaceae bacterium]